MPKWEYIFVTVSKGRLDAAIYIDAAKKERKKIRASNPVEAQIIQVLNDYGELGWEVAGVHGLGQSGQMYDATWTLKRLIPVSSDS